MSVVLDVCQIHLYLPVAVDAAAVTKLRSRADISSIRPASTVGRDAEARGSRAGGRARVGGTGQHGGGSSGGCRGGRLEDNARVEARRGQRRVCIDQAHALILAHPGCVVVCLVGQIIRAIETIVRKC